MIHWNKIAFTMSIDERCSLKTVFRLEYYVFVGIECLNKQIEFARRTYAWIHVDVDFDL